MIVGTTGLQAADNPAPGIAVAKSLKSEPEFKGKTIGLAYDSLDTGVYDSTLFDEVYLIPYPTEAVSVMLSRLNYIREKSGLEVLIPTLDAEMPMFIKIQDDLNKYGIATFLPTEDQFKMRSKDKLSQFCEENGFKHPKTMVIYDPGQIQNAIDYLGTPLVIKGIFYEAYVSYSREEAFLNYQKLVAKWGTPVIFQELIEGEEYDVAALGDGRGNLIGAVPMRKLRLTEKGKAWAGVSVMDPQIISIAKTFIEKTNWRGAVEIELMRKHNEYYLFEINPRFPAWIYLSYATGCNLPYYLACLALGENPGTCSEVKPGMIFVRHAVDFVCPIEYLEALTTKGEIVYKDISKQGGS